ncbi:MAG: C25 family cysteine peptidase, partial [Bacteroidales bacterium]|nr:C25 family cysteine peptidase [Bacteroidales bacterium]
GFYFTEKKAKDGFYTQLIVPEYYPDKNIGFPELPVMTRLIEVPLNAEFEINIISYDEQIIPLSEYGAILPIIPNQPSLFKNQDPNSVPFEKSESIYRDYEFYNPELIKTELISKMRGVQIAQITVCPFSYDIESNTLFIKNNIVVEITYKNSDFITSSNLKAEKYSPAFTGAYNKLWNFKVPSTKDAISKYPIKYVVISDRMFEETLQPFIEWKTKKGFYMTVAYTDVIGTTTTAIKEYIQTLYDAGTTENPAPTFVLFVGDVAQIPAFQCSGHVSDMYYCEFDGGGDYIPEIYFGRFSASNVSQLTPQIDKTLMFEEYTFPDPSYLAEVVLVAGDDGTFGPTHANGQINYAHNYYFNAEHGVTDYTYLYPEGGSSEAEIISHLSDGVGLVNYTAHCSQDGWGGPEFTTSDIPGLANDDEYFFSIGNCCLSNKFEVTECFGEALLRAIKKGAVIHIGGSNSTLWDEDFYWSCGVASSISASTSYEQTTQAAYDHLFHENEEDPYITAYQMAYIGNMSVTESSSSEKQYYWEIYHVMGDPSLMPYVGVPDELDASYLATIPIGMSSLTVTTEPDAYVAFSIDGVLFDAKLADGSGIAVLEFEPLTNVATGLVVVTKQFRAPHIGEVMIIPNDNDYDAMLQEINVPTTMVHITEASLSPSFTILNLGQINLTSVTVGYILNEEEPVEIEWEGDLALLSSDVVVFPEITLQAGENTINAYVSNPNGQTDEYPSNDQITKNVLVYSGEVKIVSAESPEQIYCNTNMVQPIVTIKNLDTYPLTSAIISYTSGMVYNDTVWTGNLLQNETQQIVFPECWFMPGDRILTYNIESVNGGSNLASTGTSLEIEFTIIDHGQLVVVDILTDCYPEENRWELVDDATSEIVYSAGPFSTENVHEITSMCLPEGCYTFTIFDQWGDGMSGSSWGNPADGHITITNTSTEQVLYDFSAGSNWSTKTTQFCIAISSIDVLHNNNISLYPNPSNGIINIDYTQNINISDIHIYNVLGQKQNGYSFSNHNLDISNLPSGIYMVRINTETEVFEKKIILEK